MATINSTELIRILEGLKEATTGKVAVLKEPAVYSRIIEIVKHMEKGVRPVPMDDHGFDVYTCPICDHSVRKLDDRCPGCATRINWRDE